jgi:signal transduction histidine kinase
MSFILFLLNVWKLQRIKRNSDMRFQFAQNRSLIIASCLLQVLLIGSCDYATGFENSMLLFYLGPIVMATWYLGVPVGILFSVLSVGAWIIADVAAGLPHIRIWNTLTAFAAYIIFVNVLARWHDLLKEMHLRVAERTAALQRELAARKRLEEEVAAVAEHERERLGRELHDSLCQHLAGTSLLAQTVANQLGLQEKSVGKNALKVVGLINQSIELTRRIAQGLFSSELQADGLARTLDALAESTSYEHHIACDFKRNGSVTLSQNVSSHLYWIAREAVTNAVKHARPTRITINLRNTGKIVELRVEDNGLGISSDAEVDGKGIGLKIMMQRAQLAGGHMRLQQANAHGTIVSCEIPTNA